jgi:hypothetical protein
MTHQADLTIIVNTSDSFEDCWAPFFTLFRRYWPDCVHPLVLNTETKTWTEPGLDLRCSQVAQGESRRLTWSECLMRCLDGINTPYVLYLQEDYFLEAPVRSAEFAHMLQALREGRADVLRIMEAGGSGPWTPTADPLVWQVDAQAQYRIALQAALWRKDVLRSHLRAHESPWQLEVFGSGRARRRRGEKVMCVNRDLFHGPGKEIIPYTPTGVVKGRWEKFVPELFALHGITMDFSRRGFYDRSAPPLAARRSVARRGWDRLRSFM